MTSQVLDSMDLEREKGITIKARAVRLEYLAQRRPDLRPEPDRHARARRLRLRGQPQPPGLRGRDPRRRRDPGDRGPDAGQRPPRPPRGPDPDPGPQQDRPALGRPRDDHGRARERPRNPARGGDPRLGQGRHRRPRDPRGDRRPDPAPKGDPSKPLQGLIFDSHYDAYKGVVVYVRLAQGTLHQHDAIRLMASGAEAEPLELGVFRPQLVPVKQLVAGEVGYVATGLKNVREAQVGDTVTTVAAPGERAAARLPGGEEPRLRRDLPGQRRGLSAPSRSPREAPPERRELHVRAGELRRARLRLPLRLPGPAPHGDRPGAARARVRARPDRLGAVGGVPREAPPRTRRGRRSTTRPFSRTRRRSRSSRSRGSS